MQNMQRKMGNIEYIEKNERRLGTIKYIKRKMAITEYREKKGN